MATHVPNRLHQKSITSVLPKWRYMVTFVNLDLNVSVAVAIAVCQSCFQIGLVLKPHWKWRCADPPITEETL